MDSPVLLQEPAAPRQDGGRVVCRPGDETWGPSKARSSGDAAGGGTYPCWGRDLALLGAGLTPVVSEAEAQVPISLGAQGEQEVLPLLRIVTIHSSQGLDQLRGERSEHTHTNVDKCGLMQNSEDRSEVTQKP